VEAYCCECRQIAKCRIASEPFFENPAWLKPRSYRIRNCLILRPGVPLFCAGQKQLIVPQL
jgi:hypothetical protein